MLFRKKDEKKSYHTGWACKENRHVMWKTAIDDDICPKCGSELAKCVAYAVYEWPLEVLSGPVLWEAEFVRWKDGSIPDETT